MMRRLAFSLFLFLFSWALFAQPANRDKAMNVKRPKLVVGIVVDQMRWDYLYRYNERYAANGGFKRFLNQGFSCENTLIPYTPTITACGHACIYTGSVPAIHGIVANGWWDNQEMRNVYCAEDSSVSTIGSNTTAGKMSPANMFATTVTDELRLATNFKSKVIGIAVKDRGAILPAGHSANGAFWYDNKAGKWISSTYYMQELPKWVSDFNNKGIVDKYYAQGWNTLYPINTYTESTADEKEYEGKPFGAESRGFPYDLKQMIGKNYGAINSTPFSSTMTLDLAKAAVAAEKMGANGTTDFLAVSLSSPDYIGHAFGPNSIEAEDNYLRLDRDLGNFFDFLDQQVGKGQYLIFLSADHGAAHVPGFMNENKLPGGTVSEKSWMTDLNKSLEARFGKAGLISGFMNMQVYLNNPLIEEARLDKEAICNEIIRYLQYKPGVARVFKLNELAGTTLNSKIKDMVANGFFPKRSGEIQVVFLPNWIDGGKTGTTHGSWNPYDAHIPLLWYGWNIRPGKTNRETYMTDIAATIAALLHIQMPSGNIGHVIEEISR